MEQIDEERKSFKKYATFTEDNLFSPGDSETASNIITDFKRIINQYKVTLGPIKNSPEILL